MYFILILLLNVAFFESSWGQKKNYCDATLFPLLCPEGTTHVACPAGITAAPDPMVFSAACMAKNAKFITLTEDDKKLILKLHNELRNYVACGGLRKVGLRSACRMGAVEYNDLLEETAIYHVHTCTFEHDSCRSTPDYHLAGQNLGWKSTTEVYNNSKLIDEFIHNWYEEYHDTKQSEIDKYSGTVEKIGHFMLLQKEDANRIGCALASWESKDKDEKPMTEYLFTCNYAMTNTKEKPIYNSCKEPASGCEKKDDTYPFLCSKDQLYDYTGGFELKAYDGDDKEPTDKCVDPRKSNSSQRQRINQLVLIFSITFTAIYHVLH